MNDTKIAEAIELKGGMTTLTRINILNDDLDLIAEAIKEKIKLAPNFFYKAPIIVDVKNLSDGSTLDFTKLLVLIKKLDLIAIGVSNSPSKLQQKISESGFAILRSMPSDMESTKKQLKVTKDTKSSNADNVSNNILITSPVRSGEQIYSPNGDIIIVSSVSNGAELIANGNIHVYGALRGRALAGVEGNTQARIFCTSLEAELVSIAGQYQISEDIDHNLWQHSVEINLEKDSLNIQLL